MSTRSCRLMRLTLHMLRKMEPGRSNRLRGVSYCESVFHPFSHKGSKTIQFSTLHPPQLRVPLPEPRCDHSTPRSASDGRWKGAIHQHFDGLRLSRLRPRKGRADRHVCKLLLDDALHQGIRLWIDRRCCLIQDQDLVAPDQGADQRNCPSVTAKEVIE